jgi:hypothetical protein
MRILNIVYNAEIKYQQHINSENINTDFRSNSDLGKTHKGKTSVRGSFYYLGVSEKFCYSMFIFRNLNDKLISITVPSLHTGKQAKSLKTLSRFFCNKLQVFSSISVPPKCLYGCLEIRVNSYNKFLGALMAVRPPWKPCQTFQKSHTATCLDFHAKK